METVEIFKTNVTESGQAYRLVKELQMHFPEFRINFDLHDCDKILRVQGKQVFPEMIIQLITERGHFCERLAD